MITTRRAAPRIWCAISIAALLSLAVTWLYAHEGHVALPSRGAKVDAVKGFIVLSRESRDALDVKASEITTQPLQDSVVAYATLVPPWQKHAFASSRLPGRVTKLHVQPGQTVDEGQVLAEVVSQELESLQLEILAAQIDHRLAEQVVAILNESRATVTGQAVLEADTKRLQTNNTVAIARAKWRSLGLADTDYESLLRDPGRRLNSYPVRSPIRGTIIHADLAVGKITDPGEHLFEVIDLSTVWAKVGVLEKDLRRVAIGQEVELLVSAYPDEVFQCTVQAVDFGLDPQTHLNAVWLELTNKAGKEARLLPGMTGHARIRLPVPADARVVPASALVDDGLAQYVLVEEARAEKQSEYRRRNIVVVRRTADRVEIRAGGLLPGDRVVMQGAHELGGFFVPGVLKLSPEAEKTIGLDVAVVGRHVVEDIIEIDGHVDVPPNSRGVASAPLAGNIARILVDRGASVSVGQGLAEVYSLDLKNLQLDLIREQLNFELLDHQNEALRRVGDAASKRKRLESEAELNTSRFRLDNVRNRLTQIGLSAAQIDAVVTTRRPIDTVPVRSPITGVVASFDKALGQSVKAEEPLFNIHDLSRSAVQGFVTERDVRRVSVGQSARVRLISDPETELDGHVQRSSPIVTAGDQTLSVWVGLDPPSKTTLRDGQLARVSIVAASAPLVLAVPNSAILRDGGQTFVFTRKSDAAFERRALVIGRADDRRTEVVRGLTEGETIAVRGVNGLQTAYASIR